MTVFVDSSALVALYRLNDIHAKHAEIISRTLALEKANLLTTNYIVAEALTVVSQRAGKQSAKILGQDVLSEETMSIIRIDTTIDHQAFKLFCSLKNKNISFVDCTCFTICHELGITEVFSFDKHFAKQGFNLLKP